jgi:hypothetical protein
MADMTNTLIDGWREPQDVQRVLDSWSGAIAEIQTLSARSHPQLWMELWRPGAVTKLLLICIHPQYFRGRMFWRDARLRLELLPENERIRSLEEVRLTDAGAELIQAHLVEAEHWQRVPARPQRPEAGCE